MQQRRLGNSDLVFNPLAFGGNVLGWTIDEKRSFEVLDAFIASGGNFIDTADIYCRWATGNGGESETILGKWMRQRRNRGSLIVATKVGMDMGGGRSGLSKKYILNAVHDSLKRLQTDYIDLYQSHTDDEKTPVEETLAAFAQLIKEGKVRHIGASNFSATRLREALSVSGKNGLARYQSLQPHYNLCERKTFETELEQLCIDQQLGVINYFPLASGFLTGKYRSPADFGKSPRGAGAARYLGKKGIGILNGLDAVAARHKSTPACVTLAWYLARPAITAPIASATSPEQVRELLKSVELKLDREDIEILDLCSGY